MTFTVLPSARRQLPLRVHIATLFIALILLLGGAVIWNSYAKTTRLMLRTAAERFDRIADQTARQLQVLVTPVAITVDLLAWQRLTFAASLTERLDSLGYLREALTQSEHLSALYVGYDDGDFFLLRRLPADSPLRAAHAAPDQARYLAQSVERSEQNVITAAFLFFDADLNLLRRAVCDSDRQHRSLAARQPWTFQYFSTFSGVTSTMKPRSRPSPYSEPGLMHTVSPM